MTQARSAVCRRASGREARRDDDEHRRQADRVDGDEERDEGVEEVVDHPRHSSTDCRRGASGARRRNRRRSGHGGTSGSFRLLFGEVSRPMVGPEQDQRKDREDDQDDDGDDDGVDRHVNRFLRFFGGRWSMPREAPTLTWIKGATFRRPARIRPADRRVEGRSAIGQGARPALPHQRGAAPLDIGIYTFGDITPDWRTGRAISVAERYREILAAAKLADEAGLAVFGVGEHHRLDIAISSPAVVLAAIAAATRADPARQRGHHPLDARPGPRLRGFRHPRPRLRTGGPRSSPGAAPSSNRSRSSAMTSPTTTRCSPRSSTC